MSEDDEGDDESDQEHHGAQDRGQPTAVDPDLGTVRFHQRDHLLAALGTSRPGRWHSCAMTHTREWAPA